MRIKNLLKLVFKTKVFSNDSFYIVSYHDIGGLDIQKLEFKKDVELHLTHPEQYQQIGIDPPRGVLLYGPPGQEIMLAKAITNNSIAAFIR